MQFTWGFCANNPATGLEGISPQSQNASLGTTLPSHQNKCLSFLKALENYDGYLLTKLATRFLMLTFVRTG